MHKNSCNQTNIWTPVVEIKLWAITYVDCHDSSAKYSLPSSVYLLFIICLVFQVQFGFIGTLPIVQGSTLGLYKILWELGASGWFGWNSLTSLFTVGPKIKWEAEEKVMLMRKLLGFCISKKEIQPISYLWKMLKYLTKS